MVALSSLIFSLCPLCPLWLDLFSDSDFPPAAQQAALAATVRVVPAGRVGIASGVVVGRRDGLAYVLTAQHVVANPKAELTVEWFTAEKYPRQVGNAPARRVAEWTDIDLAVLTIPDKDAPPALAIAPREAGDAENVPGLMAGCVEGKEPTCQTVTVAGKKLVKREDGSKRFFWEVTPAPELGRSGGPLIDRSGRLIGICSASQDGKGYFVHLSELRHALKDRKLGWLFEEKSDPSGGKPLATAVPGGKLGKLCQCPNGRLCARGT